MPVGLPWIICGMVAVVNVAFAQEKPEADSPEQVMEVRVGKNFVITLGSNPTTGYQWQLASPLEEAILKLVSSKYVPDKPQRIGSGGKEAWTFKAIGKGKVTLVFHYVRPWEKGVPPVKQATFAVTVRGK